MQQQQSRGPQAPFSGMGWASAHAGFPFPGFVPAHHASSMYGMMMMPSVFQQQHQQQPPPFPQDERRHRQSQPQQSSNSNAFSTGSGGGDGDGVGVVAMEEDLGEDALEDALEGRLVFCFEEALREQDRSVSEHKSDDICEFFLKGLCQKGDRCEKRHSRCAWMWFLLRLRSLVSLCVCVCVASPW